MKQRLLVMNGQRIVQTNEQDGSWRNDRIDRAGELKPGIYNLPTAPMADKSKQYEGVIAHADNERVYQLQGKQFVVHDRHDFDKVPDVGSTKTISYGTDGRAVVGTHTAKLSRGLTR